MDETSEWELILLLELLADLIEAKAQTPAEAAQIIRDKIAKLKDADR